ncbi:MAG: GNAT family protein [Actinomycetes bacterium]
MQVDFVRFRAGDPEDAAALAAFWCSNVWPFHVKSHPDRTEVEALIDSGSLDGPSDRTYWISHSGERVGFVHIEDLHPDDGDPLFDLRIHGPHRGKGIGRSAVNWLTSTVFTEHSHASRIEAQTRQDNLAMRRVLTGCGYVKEAHYRRAWPDSDGTLHDGIGYAILRDDWVSGRSTPVDWSDSP